MRFVIRVFRLNVPSYFPMIGRLQFTIWTRESLVESMFGHDVKLQTLVNDALVVTVRAGERLVIGVFAHEMDLQVVDVNSAVIADMNEACLCCVWT